MSERNTFNWTAKRIGRIVPDLNTNEPAGCQTNKLWEHKPSNTNIQKNNKVNVACYRPIRLLCCYWKALEKLLFDYIYCFFDQHFIQLSIASENDERQRYNWLYFLDKVYEDNNQEPIKELRVLYLVFDKAFNTVSHKVLPTKIWSLRFRGNILEILKSHLKLQAIYLQKSQKS